MSDKNELAFHKVLENIQLLCHLQFSGNVDARPALLDGKPGMAKTSLITDLCKRNNWGLLVIKFADQAIEEFTGIPITQKVLVNDIEFDGTTWTISDILTNTLKKFSEYKQVVVFFDDIHYATATHMQYLHTILDKSIKGHKFPSENLAFILARNTSSKAGSKIMTSPIINRCKQLPVYMDFEYWKQEFAYPHGINNKIITFLNNSAYRKYFHEDEQVNNAWASPRSWTGFSEELNMYEKFKGGYGNLSDIIYHATGYVGAEAASAFATNYELYLSVNIADIFDRKVALEIPEDYIKRYVLMMAAVNELFNRYFDEKYSKQKADIIKIISEICVAVGQKSSEICISGLKEMVLICDSLDQDKLYLKIKEEINKLDSRLSSLIQQDITFRP